MNPLVQTYKKIILIFVILILPIFSFYFFRIQINIYLKLSLLFLFLVIFLSLLTIFEMTSTTIEYLIFWLIVLLILSYFYIYAGIILFILAFLKIFTQRHILKISLKIPFVELVGKNYTFLLLAFFLITNLHFYQSFNQQNNLPLTFPVFQEITVKIDNLLTLLKIKFSFQEKISNLILAYFKKYNLPKVIADLLEQTLPQETIGKIIYNSLVNTWPNPGLRRIYILSFLSIIFLIFYPLLKIFSFLVGYLSLPFYYLFLKIKLVKINSKSVNKEILEL